MPLYEYECRKCRTRFEATQSSEEREREPAACPKCESSSEVDPVLSRFFAVTSRKS